MSSKYVKNCLTCEFGFDNLPYDKNFKPIFTDDLVIKCSGNDDLYGEEVFYKSVCDFWTVSLEEFIRIEEGISYYDFYKKYIDILDKQLDFSSILIY